MYPQPFLLGLYFEISSKTCKILDLLLYFDILEVEVVVLYSETIIEEQTHQVAEMQSPLQHRTQGFTCVVLELYCNSNSILLNNSRG